jgi:FkbM family methyltransferase
MEININILIEKILDQCLKIDKFQNYVNNRTQTKYGFQFKPSRNNVTIDQIFKDYKFNDIQKDDIVLDMGANVGGFSMFVSKMVKHVYAVEPIVVDLLKENISINKIDNITVLDKCLGRGIVKMSWLGKEKEMKGTTLSELISMCGGHVDFLKCDCEGGEWSILPEELKRIRRIEAEVHNFDGKHDFNLFLNLLHNAGFEYDHEISEDGTVMVIHGKQNIN